LLLAILAFAAVVPALSAELQHPVPRPFPKPGATESETPKPEAPPTPLPAGLDQPPPTEEMLGFPVYPTAQFIGSYNAGRGQRYYLFGTLADFSQMVGFYRTVLRQRGTLVFATPPTHMFEVGRYRSDAIAFPPGVTIKDYTWSGSEGYPNPVLGQEPARFPTVIQIVPPPVGVQGR
jgi:hypothetical protein